MTDQRRFAAVGFRSGELEVQRQPDQPFTSTRPTATARNTSNSAASPSEGSHITPDYPGTNVVASGMPDLAAPAPPPEQSDPHRP